ncbi:hypothetical protein [Alicyclobacillus pomorum]|jgi:hypothetical protein|uniref:hypothetical protein n=1 Tax=Alicyclobacillus pomorum TaxID=204470 RepID=UPI0004070E05|nr:hypothetical protein [Alicyclobacillus pomorum]
MSEYTTDKGIWNGWYWRLIGLSVMSIAIVQLLLKYVIHYSLFVSLPMAVLVISYIVVPRAKERTLANALLGVFSMFVVSAALALIFEPAVVQQAAKQHIVRQFLLEYLALPLLLGITLAYGYLRLSQWSDKKRAELEEKRRAQMVADKPVPPRRIHRKKKRKKR